MSHFEKGTLISGQLPKSTQSFEEMFDEIANNDSKTDMASINSRYFDLSPISNHESDNKTPIDKESHTSITKVTQNADMLESELKDGIELNDYELSFDYCQSQMNLENKNLDRYSSTQETLCTECRFGTRLNSFFTFINTSQRPTQGSCLTHTAQIRDKDLCSEGGSSQKRSLSVTLERQNSNIDMEKSFSLQKCTKRLKSEGSISTIRNSGINIGKTIKPTVGTPRISSQNLCAISQRTESFAKVYRGTISAEAEHSNDVLKHTDELVEPLFKLYDHGRVLPNDSTLCQVQSQKLEHSESIENSLVTSMLQHVEKISIFENISTANGTDRISLNEIIQSQSQDLDEINSNCSYSTFSQSTIEEIYCIEATDEIDYSKTIKMFREIPGMHSLNNSTCSQNTIDEVYRTSIANGFCCSTIAEDSEYYTAEKICAPSIISNEVIKDRETTDKAVKDFSLQPLIHLLPNETNKREKNPVNLCREKNLERKCAVINRKAEDDLESQCLNETQLKKIERQDELTMKNVIPGSMIDDPVEGTDFSNDRISNIPDDSFLEISVDSLSDLEQMVKRGLNVEKEKTKSVHVQINNIKTNSTNSTNVSEGKKGTMDRPINLSLVNTNSCSLENLIPLKDVGAKNVETKIASNDFGTQFLTDKKLNNIGRHAETVEKEIKSVNSTTNRGANRTAIKNPSVNPQCPQDDLSLEFLSESELQKIEEEAYMKAKQRSTIDLKNINTKSGINGEDVFYRPERSNAITEKKNDDLILPTWVTNPAPEPNYEKMKRAIRMKREYVKKMLQEILRLSTIVSKVRSIVYAKPQYGGSEIASKGSLQIQEPCPIHQTENNPKNRLPQSGTSSDMEFNTNHWSNTVATNLKDNDVFYVPQSSKPKYNARSNIVVASVNNSAIKTDGIREDSGKRGVFYEPRLSRSKYDAPPIFNRSNDTGFNRGNVSNSYMQSNASSIFSSLKQDFKVNPRTQELDDSNVWNTGGENETGIRSIKSDTHLISKNKENFAKPMTTEHQLSRIGFNSTVFAENKTVLNKNRIEPVGNNTNFYLPNRLSSASNNYTILPSVKNNQILSSVNVSKWATADTKLAGQTALNFGKNLVPHNTSCDNSIFYTGNKKGGATNGT